MRTVACPGRRRCGGDRGMPPEADRTTPQSWVPLALGVLPEIPCEVTCLRDDGGQLRVTLYEASEEWLHARMAVMDARKGLRLTIPVERAKRGGYSVGCTIAEVYFLGGLDSSAVLTVDE